MIAKVAVLFSGLLLLTISGSLVLRAAPQSAELRSAERLWAAGRIAEARQQYLALSTGETVPALVLVRLASIALLRGTCPDAQAYAGRALLQPDLRRDEAAQLHLVVGQCAALADDSARAERAWNSVDPRSPYRSLADVLRGEHALRSGALVTARSAYESALAEPLAEPWLMLVRFRLALLLAAESPSDAARLLTTIPLPPSEPTPETRPFLPLPAAELAQQSLQLRAILAQPDAQRQRLLGQQLLTLGLYRLAIVRLEQISAASTESVALANADAAYARWQLGQQAAATTQLRELAAAAPESPAIATLYATLAIHAGQPDAAAAALDAAEARHPLDPALALVRADLLIARREYARAIVELRRARDIAQPEQRGRYALALAAHHLRLTYDLCGGGITAAREATTIAPADPASWQALAAALYHCRAYDDAAAAARSGLERDPAQPALAFYLGAALWADGQHDAARPHLIAAIDRAPASEWRVRAEELLGW